MIVDMQKRYNEQDLCKLQNTIRKLEALNEFNERLITQMNKDNELVTIDLKHALDYCSLLIRHQGSYFTFKLSRCAK